MSRRSPFAVLQQVRDVRERLARTEAARAHHAWVEATSAVVDGEETLREMSFPDRGSRSSFLAAAAAMRAQAGAVVALRAAAEQRAAGKESARQAWTLAEQDRSAAERLMQREAARVEAERSRMEQRDLDELGQRSRRPQLGGSGLTTTSGRPGVAMQPEAVTRPRSAMEEAL